ncbi:hypothetical protein EYF80_019863 [Liparis tanakae]|uniref:Uncharacterized protein n=1 Tax=Liparis tanakae TaxID=230148 RepID=A0A4Z2HWL5_9TELE|nr:hypothetical protein EYF80_019863 [Liparis tanakae]
MADPWCWWGKATGSGVSVTLEPNVGPPGTQCLEGVQPEEELMSSLDPEDANPIFAECIN